MCRDCACGDQAAPAREVAVAQGTVPLVSSQPNESASPPASDPDPMEHHPAAAHQALRERPGATATLQVPLGLQLLAHNDRQAQKRLAWRRRSCTRSTSRAMRPPSTSSASGWRR
jgi:hypothetical protein